LAVTIAGITRESRTQGFAASQSRQAGAAITGAHFANQSLAPVPPAAGGLRPDLMVRIAISQAAFDAIAGMLRFPLGSVSYENASNTKGERYVWLDPKVVEHLRALRGPGESFSDVILRLAGEG
jgi:hypothetical protein